MALKHGTAARVREAGARLFDRLVGVPVDDPQLRAAMFDTAMLRPLGLATASMGFMLMSGAAAILTGKAWAAAWFAFDCVLLIVRLLPTVKAARAGARIQDRVARLILAGAFLLFVTFGIGCALSFATGIEALRITAVVAVMGLIGAMATRWAGVPRIAVAVIGAVATPMTVALASTSRLGAIEFVVLALGTAVLTIQNHRTLLAMLRAEREARRLAGTDALTGLLNRTGLKAALTDRACWPLTADAAIADRAAIAFFDLDGFKAVNDRYGHAAGDAVLREIGRRLASVSDGHLAARLGGDEFVIVVTGAAVPFAAGVAEDAADQIRQPLALVTDTGASAAVSVGSSVGIAAGSLARHGLEALLAEADRALYGSKRDKAAPFTDPIAPDSLAA